MLLFGFWSAAHARVHVPLFTDGSNPMQQSFVRLVNLEADSADLLVRAINDQGEEFGPVSFTLDGHSARHFNSDHMQDRLSAEVDVSESPRDWRLFIDSAESGRFHARDYMRTHDGFVTSMQDRAPTDCNDGGTSCFLAIPIFNPASNQNQRSLLRLINTASWGPAEVTIIGVDDDGVSPGTEVRLTLDPLSSRTLTALELESGAVDITGALENGKGKWRLEVHAEGGSVEALSLLESPTGHLTNLSTKGWYFGDIYLFRNASHPTQQSFARIINVGDVQVTVDITAVDDDGTRLGSFSLEVPANGAKHFNSNHVAEWLDIGNETGDLRLSVDRKGYFNEIEVFAYIRTRDGFLTSMHDLGGEIQWFDGSHEYEGSTYRYVPFFNPGRNSDQRSQLRVVNLSDYTLANFSIVAIDDSGASRGGVVRLSLPAGASRTISSKDLEVGGSGFDGYLGEGVGKWRMFVFQEDESYVYVMSLLESPTGHLTNLMDQQLNRINELKPIPPPPIPDTKLRALVAETLGKSPDAQVSRTELADLTSFYVPPESGVENWIGLQVAVNLTRLEIAGTGQFDLSALAGLAQLQHLDLGYNEVADLTPLSGLTNLTYLNLVTEASSTPLARLRRLQHLSLASRSITDLSPLSGLTDLQTLYLWNTAVTDITPLAGLTALQKFALPANIEDISPLAGLTELQTLTLPRNAITDITPLAGLTRLRTLDLTSNLIADLSPLAELHGLTTLDLGRNQIRDISALAELTTLQYLYLGHNDISDISPLAGLTTLQELGLSDNDISDISPLAGLTTLQELGLSDNDVSDISPLAGLTALQTLLLAGNSISDISALQNLTGLNYLDLSHNAVEDVSALEGLTNLYSLNLGYNRIEDLAPLAANSGLGDGDRIDLTGNSTLTDESVNVVIAELTMRGARVDVPVLRGVQFEAVHNDNVAAFRVNVDIEKAHPHPDFGTDLPLDELTTEFYKHFEDDFDFIAIVANVETDGGLRSTSL